MKLINILLFIYAISSFSLRANDVDLSYSYDEKVYQSHNEWMNTISNNTMLNRLSIIGSHNSGSRLGGDSAQTQSLSIKQQLEAGIRLFDIRLVQWSNKMYLYHGPIYQDLSLDKVISDMKDFLSDHPSETLIVRIKKEGDSVNAQGSFGDVIGNYIQNDETYFYRKAKNLNNVTLGDVRKKIVILRDFNANSPAADFGYKYSKNHGNYVISDDHYLSHNWALYDKWLDVKSAIKTANDKQNLSSYKKKTFVTFLSGSGGVFPYFVASGKSSSGTSAGQLLTGLTTPAFKSWYPDFPRGSCFIGICSIYFSGTNMLTYKHIEEGKLTFVGWVFADFPGPGLIRRIVNTNPKNALASKSNSCTQKEFKICFFEHGNYRGIKSCYTKQSGDNKKSIGWVGSLLNDSWSSYQVNGGNHSVNGTLETCQHSNYSGYCNIRAENSNRFIHDQNDDISSFKFQCSN